MSSASSSHPQKTRVRRPSKNRIALDLNVQHAGVGSPALAEASLVQIRKHLGDCKRCELHEGRTHIVFGAGSPKARVVIIGEAPGKTEDEQGKPFVGRSGAVLDDLLERAGLTRDEIYICNVVKCRPPGNRNPKAHEIQECSPFLREQLKAIWPEVIVTLGNFATRFVLKTDEGITTLRGRVHEVGRFKVLPIFHPAAAMYDRSKMASLEADFDLLKSVLTNQETQESQEDQGAQDFHEMQASVSTQITIQNNNQNGDEQ